MDLSICLGFLCMFGICSLTIVECGKSERLTHILWGGGYGYRYVYRNGYDRLISKEATTLTTPATSLDTLKDPIANFSVSLFKIARPDGDPNGNKFMSPFSVMTALMLTMLGTGGNTESQIMSALQLHGISRNIHQEYKELLDYLNTVFTNDNIIVAIANRLFPRLGFALKHQYRLEAERYYGSEVEPLDFVGQPEISRKYINDWASKITSNLIKDILPVGSVNRNSIMFLVNAIYFKSSWQIEFNKTNTIVKDFHVSSTITEKVEMMKMITEKLRSGANIEFNCKVLELPYKGGEFNMVIILPNSIHDVTDLENKLTADALASIFASLREQETDISIPKFKMLSGFKNLKAPLQQLGITDLFTGPADFSNMFVNPSGLTVDKVIHKAFLMLTRREQRQQL